MGIKIERKPESSRNIRDYRRLDQMQWTDRDTRNFEEYGGSKIYKLYNQAANGLCMDIGARELHIIKLSEGAYKVITYRVYRHGTNFHPDNREVWLFPNAVCRY